eukprot:653430-Rhodomonas_salina.2
MTCSGHLIKTAKFGDTDATRTCTPTLGVTFCNRNKRGSDHQVPSRGQVSELSSEEAQAWVRTQGLECRDIVDQVGVDQEGDQAGVDKLSEKDVSGQTRISQVLGVLLLEPHEDLQDDLQALIDGCRANRHKHRQSQQLSLVVDVLCAEFRLAVDFVPAPDSAVRAVAFQVGLPHARQQPNANISL